MIIVGFTVIRFTDYIPKQYRELSLITGTMLVLFALYAFVENLTGFVTQWVPLMFAGLIFSLKKQYYNKLVENKI